MHLQNRPGTTAALPCWNAAGGARIYVGWQAGREPRPSTTPNAVTHTEMSHLESTPYLTANEMREVDRVMIEELRIELIQMMESAGRALAALARDRFMDGDPTGRRVLVLCGTGNNGGGGLVCARRLYGWGASLRVVTTKPVEEFFGVPEHQADIIGRLGIPMTAANQPTVLGDVDLIIDAIIGYGLSGAPHGEAERLIHLANEFGAPVLSLDNPSGLDVSDGTAAGAAVRATATLTLAVPKVGLQKPGASEYVGELYLGDLGVPPEVYSRSGLAYDVGPIFAREEIVRL